MRRPAAADLPHLKRLLILGNVAVFAALVLVVLQRADTRHRAHGARAQQTAVALAQSLSQDISAGFQHIDDGLTRASWRAWPRRSAPACPPSTHCAMPRAWC